MEHTGIMHRVDRTLSYVVDALTVVAGLAIALMMLHVTADVVMRSVFNRPLPGTITIVSNYYMVIAAFVPLAFAERRNGHISVEVVTELLPPHVRKHLAGWMLTISGATFAVLAVRTWGEAMVKYQIGASIVQGESRIPIWQSYFFLPLGCALMFLVVLCKFIAYLGGREFGEETASTPEMPGAAGE